MEEQWKSNGRAIEEERKWNKRGMERGLNGRGMDGEANGWGKGTIVEGRVGGK
jgi:hypothetical protein